MVASANHVLDTYPDRGYGWAARYYDYFFLDVSSDNCNPAELDAFERVLDSTSSASGDFNDRWPRGINLERASSGPCNGTVSGFTDIKLAYSDFCDTHGCGTFGGENHSTLAPTSYCNTYQAGHYPCGSHPSRVHINHPKYQNTSQLGKARLIMHETGHSLGLGHHCTSDSIMNDGTSGCNGGAWTSVMVYKVTDRAGILGVYPGWQYP